LHATYDQEIQAQRPVVHLNFSEAGGGFLDSASGTVWSPAGAGTILYRQPAPLPGRKAMSLDLDAAVAAPRAGLASFEWTQPFTLTVEVSATVMTGGYAEWLIAGKGVPATMGSNIRPGDPAAQGIFLYVNALMGIPEPQACLMLAAGASVGGPSTTVACGDVVNLGDGQPHQITATYDGSGMASGIGIAVDGIPVGSPSFGSTPAAPGAWGFTRGSYGTALGAVQVTVRGGSGYAAATAFTSTGGGPNCAVAGTMLAQGGVPTGVTYSANGYCTSAPAIALEGATGTGAAVVATLLNTSIVSDQPWYLNGDAGGVMAGFRNSAPGMRTIDDFAIMAGVAPASMAQDLALYANAAWNGLAGVCAKRPNVVAIEDGDNDFDNWGLMAAAVTAHTMGCINLVGVEDNQGGSSVAWYRQALDEAGLAHVPVGQTPQSSTVCGGTNTNWADEPGNLCGPWRNEDAATSAYDANYRQRMASGVMTDVQMYTQVLGKYSNVNLVDGGALNGIEDLMLSPGGLALFQTRVAAVYQQEGMCADSGGVGNFGLGLTASEYVLAHNGNVPVYLFGGDASCMPSWIQGVEEYTRGANDPWDAMDVKYHLGGDSRTPFDSWGLMELLLPGLFAVGNGPGTMTLSGTMAGGDAEYRFSTATNSHHYWMRYVGPPGNFSGVLNGLINANPGLPMGTPQ
jgi:hypothetical protein